MAKKRIKSRQGLFGTVYYYDENGNPIGKSRPGLISGTKVYTDQNGRYSGKSRPGFLPKEVFTDPMDNQITSYDSIGGEIHFKNGAPVGHTKQGFFDTAYTELEDECDEEALYEEELIVESKDDFAEASEEFGSDVSRHTVIKNLFLFALSLVICAVIACVYAIIKFN